MTAENGNSIGKIRESGLLVPHGSDEPGILPISDPETIRISQTERELLRQTIISLLGEPGIGKSAGGKRAAAMVGMKFIDTDGLVEKRVKMPVGEYIEKYGRPAFYVVQDAELQLALFTDRNLIIGTGGATVEKDRPQNIGPLRMKSVMVYMHGDLEENLDRLDVDETYRPGMSHLIEELPDGTKVRVRTTREYRKGELIRRWEARHDAWETSPVDVDTTGRNINQVAVAILRGTLDYLKEKSESKNRYQQAAGMEHFTS